MSFGNAQVTLSTYQIRSHLWNRCSFHPYRFLCNVSQASRPGPYRSRPQSSAGFWPLCRFSVAGGTFLKSLWPSREHNRTHCITNSNDDFINVMLTAVYLLIDILGLEAFLFGVIAHLSEPLEEERVGAGWHGPLPAQTHCFRRHVDTVRPATWSTKTKQQQQNPLAGTNEHQPTLSLPWKVSVILYAS